MIFTFNVSPTAELCQDVQQEKRRENELMMSLNSCLNTTTIFQLFMVQTLGVEEEMGVLVQFCAEDLYLYTELSY